MKSTYCIMPVHPDHGRARHFVYTQAEAHETARSFRNKTQAICVFRDGVIWRVYLGDRCVRR